MFEWVVLFTVCYYEKLRELNGKLRVVPAEDLSLLPARINVSGTGEDSISIPSAFSEVIDIFPSTYRVNFDGEF